MSLSIDLPVRVRFLMADYQAENLDSLLAASYPHSAIWCLTAANTAAGVPLATARALVASILNAVVSDHGLSRLYLVQVEWLIDLQCLRRRY